MAKKIRLDIVTPERVAYSADVNMVIARTSSGDIGVLPGHAPLIAGLQIAPFRILLDEGEAQIALSGGFIEVQPEKVTLLANTAELAEEIDVERAENSKKRAESRLKSGEAIDAERAEIALRRAVVRLKVAEYGKHPKA
ncbi:MAG: F0F1 ATP synthase subunit epsilon [Pelosinus sp.]|nr:F0F1 ATP synthase subunit epsilon [Pelosinus sp.]